MIRKESLSHTHTRAHGRTHMHTRTRAPLDRINNLQPSPDRNRTHVFAFYWVDIGLIKFLVFFNQDTGASKSEMSAEKVWKLRAANIKLKKKKRFVALS